MGNLRQHIIATAQNEVTAQFFGIFLGFGRYGNEMVQSAWMLLKNSIPGWKAMVAG